MSLRHEKRARALPPQKGRARRFKTACSCSNCSAWPEESCAQSQSGEIKIKRRIKWAQKGRSPERRRARGDGFPLLELHRDLLVGLFVPALPDLRCMRPECVICSTGRQVMASPKQPGHSRIRGIPQLHVVIWQLPAPSFFSI